ncbi:MAG: PTS sugar transporter subunit IIB [Anaerorhabdus sp.]|uniref:PTS system mannose/fructose/N-acetylgalactosamine-transporter subunit IIB n=1 Tax=Anaerorhabdus sp. TaxID=1872524 RepID=UPI002FCA99D2
MAIVEVRIDDRLIHGQVCGFWIPHYSVNKIVIVDNKIVNDEMRKTALQIGCPAKVKLSILNSLTASDKLKRKLDEGSNVLILTANPHPLLEMVEDGYEIKKIKIGNLSSKEGSVQIKRTVFVSPDELDSFKKLIAKGVTIESHMIPSEHSEDITEIIRTL